MHKELKKGLEQKLLKRLESCSPPANLTETGYWAECLELPGCATEAETVEELRSNAEEALNLYLDEPVDSTVPISLPQTYTTTDVIEVPVNPSVALSALLRKYREEHHYTQKEVAEKLGMKNLYSYQ